MQLPSTPLQVGNNGKVYRKAFLSGTGVVSLSANYPKKVVQPVAQLVRNTPANTVFSLPTPSSTPTTPSCSKRSNGAAMAVTPALSPPPSYKPVATTPRKVVVISDSKSEPGSPSPRPARLELLPPTPVCAQQLDVPEPPDSPSEELVLSQLSAEMQAGCDALEIELFASLRRLAISDEHRNQGPSSPVDGPDPAPPYHVVNPPPEFSRSAKTFYVVCHSRQCGVYTDWPYVNSLVSGIGNGFKKYKNIGVARQSYFDNKARRTLIVE